MHSMPLMAFAPPQPIDKPRAVEPVAKTADSSGAGLGSGRESFAEDNAAAPGLFRSATSARQDRAEPETPPLDTRVVGDLDKIDPMRPTARMPDPIVTLEDLRRATPVADPSDVPTKPDGANPDQAAAAETDATDASAPQASGNSIDLQPALPPPPPAPSPAAAAPDVPEPPPPGQYDLRR